MRTTTTFFLLLTLTLALAAGPLPGRSVEASPLLPGTSDCPCGQASGIPMEEDCGGCCATANAACGARGPSGPDGASSETASSPSLCGCTTPVGMPDAAAVPIVPTGERSSREDGRTPTPQIDGGVTAAYGLAHLLHAPWAHLWSGSGDPTPPPSAPLPPDHGVWRL